MTRLTPAALLAAISLSGCMSQSPEQVCASPQVHQDVISVLIANLGEYRIILGDGVDAAIARRADIAAAITDEIKFSDIAVEGRDPQTKRITCSTNVFPASGDGQSYRLKFTRQKEAGGREYLYTTSVSDGSGSRQTTSSLPDAWFFELVANATKRLQPSEAKTDAVRPAEEQDIPTASYSSDQTLYERSGLKLVSNNEENDVFCIGCEGSLDRRPLGLGLVYFAKAWGDFVLLTQNTGNAAGGGTTYAVNLKTMKINDLQTNSGAGPTFEFERSDGGVIIEVSQSGRKRRLVLVPATARPQSPETDPAPSETSAPRSDDAIPSLNRDVSKQSPSQPPTLTPASWISQPKPTMPQRAIDAGVTGAAQLQCTVTTAGRLADCEALWESPPRYGLGPAAVAGALTTGRLRPATSGNEPVPSTIRFRVAFEAQ